MIMSKILGKHLPVLYNFCQQIHLYSCNNSLILGHNSQCIHRHWHKYSPRMDYANHTVDRTTLDLRICSCGMRFDKYIRMSEPKEYCNNSPEGSSCVDTIATVTTTLHNTFVNICFAIDTFEAGATTLTFIMSDEIDACTSIFARIRFTFVDVSFAEGTTVS